MGGRGRERERDVSVSRSPTKKTNQMKFSKSNTTIHVESEFPFVPYKDACKEAIKAILESDANKLRDAVASASIPIEPALSIAIQAWRADLKANKVGVRMHSGGLLSAVFTGTMRSQELANTIDHGDNSVFLLATLAAEKDDPKILDVLISWEPGFRLGPLALPATPETTANFFMDMQAPKCANRILERKSDMFNARRNGLFEEHSDERALRNARRIKEKGLCASKIGRDAIDDIIDGEGRVQVAVIEGDDVFHIISYGLSLIGKPEIVTICQKDDIDITVQKVKDFAILIARGEKVVSAQVILGKKHFLHGILNATKHIRSPKTPTVVAMVD